MVLCLEAQSVSKKYGSVNALSDVTLGLHSGEVVALLGDNGAGKSTLMNILCGNRQPDEGAVISNGQRLASAQHAQSIGVGMVYQDLALAPDLSVTENIFLGRERRRSGLRGRLGEMDQASMHAAANQAVTTLGGTIPDVSAPVVKLSGGQRQIAAVARTIMFSTVAILLDEPTAALGPKQVGIVIDAIRNAARQGLGVLVISHDVPHMLDIADRLVVLRRGRTVLDQPSDGLTLPHVVAAMVGDTDLENESEPA
ncbi:ATP-binding cassette domain-containing protein [Rhodococcus globerulus]|uniref:ATP-binding cassette domain-containing protein n=1 Tax=Rhodococcus globerulus TaxID=33008 RepID=A0ABU4C2S4_RHOGO|nr:ATP-binding cassette domain-containing protein [Rhodococcus globerulus]MDV6270800.1 ATP-binding cassette domain-containing protein [Rhodococcus globerulus]